jgi:hypothetical protein
MLSEEQLKVKKEIEEKIERFKKALQLACETLSKLKLKVFSQNLLNDNGQIALLNWYKGIEHSKDFDKNEGAFHFYVEIILK